MSVSLHTGIEESKKNKQNKGLLGKSSIRYRRCFKGTASGFKKKGMSFLMGWPLGRLVICYYHWPFALGPRPPILVLKHIVSF